MTKDSMPERDDEVNVGNQLHLAHVLDEHNKWRRGIGEYAWNEDPSKNKGFPFSARMLGIAIDESVKILKRMGKA